MIQLYNQYPESNTYHSLIRNIHVLQTLLETIIVSIYAHTVQIGMKFNAVYDLNSLLNSTYKYDVSQLRSTVVCHTFKLHIQVNSGFKRLELTIVFNI